MGLTVPGAETSSLQQSANLAHQLQLIKGFLSTPITALVDDSSNIKNIFKQIESQLPEPLQIKLWPASNLPFFRIEVSKAQERNFSEKVSESELPGWYWILIDLREAVLSS